MRTFLCAALLPLVPVLAVAQTDLVKLAKPVAAEAELIEADGTSKSAWIISATQTQIRYLATKLDTDPRDMMISKVKSIYIMEPKEFTKAVDLFQARKYAEAKGMFGALKERYKFMQAMPGNYSALSAYYELECLRKLGDLEGLAAGLQKFIKDPLLRPNHLKQIEAYVFWDAVRTKGWQRVDLMAKEWAAERVPNFIRAQIGYCHGLALEALDKPFAALNAYNTAITADSGASEEITRQAALNILRIHKADPDVQLAIKLWGDPDENKNSSGRFRLLEASAVAHIYEKFMSGGTPLPSEFQGFLKYKVEEEKGSS
jgi:tetratricopeptide (TPR) repeat protein